MVINGMEAIEGFLKKNAAARSPMARWAQVVRDHTWQDITDLRKAFNTADAIKGTPLTCFNIGGNSYRLLAVVMYQQQQVTIVELLTHAEYSRKYT